MQDQDLTVQFEPFDNGARVQWVVSHRIDAPGKIPLAAHADPGSVPLDYCVLTATMDNLACARPLWLAGEIVNSLRHYR